MYKTRNSQKTTPKQQQQKTTTTTNNKNNIKKIDASSDQLIKHMQFCGGGNSFFKFIQQRHETKKKTSLRYRQEQLGCHVMGKNKGTRLRSRQQFLGFRTAELEWTPATSRIVKAVQQILGWCPQHKSHLVSILCAILRLVSQFLQNEADPV